MDERESEIEREIEREINCPGTDKVAKIGKHVCERKLSV